MSVNATRTNEVNIAAVEVGVYVLSYHVGGWALLLGVACSSFAYRIGLLILDKWAKLR